MSDGLHEVSDGESERDQEKLTVYGEPLWSGTRDTTFSFQCLPLDLEAVHLLFEERRPPQIWRENLGEKINDSCQTYVRQYRSKVPRFKKEWINYRLLYSLGASVTGVWTERDVLATEKERMTRII